MDADWDAKTARLHDPLFISQCSLAGLEGKLPLVWPTPPGTPPSPKRHYRSLYVYGGWQDLRDPSLWEHLSSFDLLLRLIDFAPLGPVLAQRLGWVSARGWTPFDPVSVFLLQGWQITNGWSRTATLKHLADPRYADYAHRFGFQAGDLPTEGGLRYALTALGRHSQVPGRTVSVALDDGRTVPLAVEYLNHLVAGSLTLIHHAGFISPEAWEKALVCPDGMLHDAASRLRCTSVRESCYQPLTPEQPTRPCPAKEGEKPHRGCACNTLACAQVCKHATPRDPQARLVVYSGSNQTKDNPNQPLSTPADRPPASRLCYGYRSLCLELADPIWRTSFVALSTFAPAPQREENPAAALLRQVPDFYPTLHLHTTAGDAGLGYYAYLHAAHELGVRRVVDLRADPTDTNKDGWILRGYDDKGRPLCDFGYAFASNGYDPQRHCHKWMCGQACLHQVEPRVTLPNVIYPPPECDYQDPTYLHGQILSVGERFGDDSVRLVRDLPVGTPAWERAYHRARNASEGRHAIFEGWGLKRLSVYGQPRGKAMSFQADTWANLTTMARLVQEATMAATARGP